MRYIFHIVIWYPYEFSKLHNLHPLYKNSQLYIFISSEEYTLYYLQVMPITFQHFSFNQVPIIAG